MNEREQRSDPVRDCMAAARGARTPGTSLASALRRPAQEAKTPACSADCATGSDVRGWLGVVAQRRKLGLTDEQAFARGWNIVASVNPFPATLGRICPHPCERNCSRAAKDGAVAIGALERFLGDWALENGLRLPTLDEGRHPESIGVIGGGPAGLSFAYQMARRGYGVTLYEKEAKAGGMLQQGIPEYRLPQTVLAREIARLADIGVDFRLGTTVGRDIAAQEVWNRHAAIFLGIGATRTLRPGIAGEDGPGVWSGVDYLAACKRGEAVDLGNAVAVVGGGNTAMDAARTARRAGAQVMVLYRRTAAEMPAIADGVAEALAEGVVIEFLTSPVRIERNESVLTGVVAQRMRLGEPEASGRRSVFPREDSAFLVSSDSVIAAVSQAPDLSSLGRFVPDGATLLSAESSLLAGGDVLGPGIAGSAIAQGRRAAEELHEKLRGLDSSAVTTVPSSETPHIKLVYYAARERIATPTLSVAARFAKPDAEVAATISQEQFVTEAQRCFSCGLCFGCEHCFMYCNPGGFTRLTQAAPGAYFALSLDRCEGCGKCIEVCPCGFLSVAPDAAGLPVR